VVGDCDHRVDQLVAVEQDRIVVVGALDCDQLPQRGCGVGDREPVKVLFSNRDDVMLANPFGPAVRGWRAVSAALDYASSRFRDGEVTAFERVAKYGATDLVSIHELERWRAKVAGREEASEFDLRVTSTFRREDDAWKLVHRHADPIGTAHPDGPLRGSGE
jgi:ketosteroid isomerase-like protein